MCQHSAFFEEFNLYSSTGKSNPVAIMCYILRCEIVAT